MTNADIAKLLDKYHAGVCTPEERLLLELWLENNLNNTDRIPSEQEKARIWQAISNSTQEQEIQSLSKPRIPIWKWSAAAAVLLLGLTLTWNLSHQHKTKKAQVEVVQQGPITPGTEKAVLTLSDGRQIDLSSISQEGIADQGVEISRNKEGLLQYKVLGQNTNSTTAYNTIETPRGGQYNVLLPDGSEILLNASSKLKFPVNLHLQDQRQVEFSGEGYFQIKKDAAHPFVVKTEAQEMKVLGTAFNVNTYRQAETVTTLIEGKVQVNNQEILRPGQQARSNPNGTTLKNVQVEDFIDWKNKLFIFRDEPLESIMERVSRWYDVDVKYVNSSNKQIKFNGEVSRYAKVEELLDLLRKTSTVQFAVQGRTIEIR